MAKIDLTSFEWCELIFKGKNKAYGAYKMRADSPKRQSDFYTMHYPLP